MSHRPDAAWTPLDAAAARLGISPDAVRKRLERGTLTGEKRGGRWFVWLDAPDGPDAEPGRHPSGQPDATRTPPDAVPETARELIDHLKDENAFLRDQLDQSRRELAAERERFDVIHREALQRIEALTAGPDTDRSPATSPPDDQPTARSATEAAARGEIPPNPESWFATAWRRLWRRS